MATSICGIQKSFRAGTNAEMCLQLALNDHRWGASSFSAAPRISEGTAP
jgi:hypothetical protein